MQPFKNWYVESFRFSWYWYTRNLNLASTFSFLKGAFLCAVNGPVEYSINAKCSASYIFLVSNKYISLSKIVGINAIDPLNKANNPKVAIYSCLAFHIHCSWSSL